jgi:hypothetical protein
LASTFHRFGLGVDGLKVGSLTDFALFDFPASAQESRNVII